MQRVVTYLYPQDQNASHLKVFQDRTNHIKAFYFTRDYIKEVEQLESGKNYAVYFLFDKTDNEELTKVYVGQSKNGAYRMQNHNNEKMFWSFCLMFVTDNNSFDTLTIDYLEYYFINKLDEKIEAHGDEFKTLINLTFSNPSAVASLISGLSENGWKFFEGIEELRKK